MNTLTENAQAESTLADRVKIAREYLGLSQQAVADAVGMSQPSYFKIESGKTKRTTFISELAKVLQVNADWLATGQGEMVIQKDIASQQQAYSSSTKSEPATSVHRHADDIVCIGAPSEYAPVAVTYLDIKASCGGGYINDDHPASSAQYFSVEFLRENDLPTDGVGVVLMHACNDSMGYTIPSKSMMLVDTNNKAFDNFVNDKVYIFNVNGEMICKRAVKNLDGSILLKSDNTDKTLYPDQIITRDTFEQFDLFGRVHWVSKKI